jgi:hypothetical protein
MHILLMLIMMTFNGFIILAIVIGSIAARYALTTEVRSGF